MSALLLVAHGSRRQQSNDEVFQLADRLNQHCADQYNPIHAAFLEIVHPSIMEGIKQCVDAGATSIIVLPYFLNSGWHVVGDIPNIVKRARLIYPNADLILAPHLGASEKMLSVVIDTAHLTN